MLTQSRMGTREPFQVRRQPVSITVDSSVFARPLSPRGSPCHLFVGIHPLAYDVGCR